MARLPLKLEDCFQIRSGPTRALEPFAKRQHKDPIMNNIVYIVGLIVIIAAVASYFGLR